MLKTRHHGGKPWPCWVVIRLEVAIDQRRHRHEQPPGRRSCPSDQRGCPPARGRSVHKHRPDAILCSALHWHPRGSDGPVQSPPVPPSSPSRPPSTPPLRSSIEVCCRQHQQALLSCLLRANSSPHGPHVGEAACLCHLPLPQPEHSVCQRHPHLAVAHSTLRQRWQPATFQPSGVPTPGRRSTNHSLSWVEEVPT